MSTPCKVWTAEEEAAINTARRILDLHHGRLESPDEDDADGYRIILPAA